MLSTTRSVCVVLEEVRREKVGQLLLQSRILTALPVHLLCEREANSVCHIWKFSSLMNTSFSAQQSNTIMSDLEHSTRVCTHSRRVLLECIVQ